jgi:hypothetical protein
MLWEDLNMVRIDEDHEAIKLQVPKTKSLKLKTDQINKVSNNFISIQGTI